VIAGVVVISTPDTDRYILIVQVLRYWPFGALWCRIWLAVDVWLCTASILNLCAISLDRYIAISRPVKYPTVMSPRRARLLIVCVWILSFIICFPPLIGWNERGGFDFSNDVTNGFNWTRPRVDDVIHPGPVVQLYDDSQEDTRYNVIDSGDSMTSQQPGFVTQHSHVVVSRDECVLTSVPGYIVYSACGSFWVPMLGMVVFYWKIYKTAVAATDAVNRGFVEQKMTGLLTTTSSGQAASCRLRVHRGGPAPAAQRPRPSTTDTASTASVSKVRHSAGCISELLPRPSANRPPARHSVDAQLLKTSTTTPTTATSTVTTTSTTTQRAQVTSYPVPTIVITSSTSFHDDTEHGVNKNTNVGDVTSSRGDDVSKAAAAEITRHDVKPSPSGSHVERQSKSCDDVNTPPDGNLLALHESASPPSSSRTSTSSMTSTAEKRTSLIASRFAKLHIISQLRSLNKEKKAAKTVGVIIGCFIVCWAPFFTVYLVGAFCRYCTPAILFNIFFWLGYCNSAANPFIYGLCSRDFRYAFQKFLRCRYRRTKPALRHSANSQMMTMLQSLTMQVVAGGTVNAAANVTAAGNNKRRRH